MAMQDMNQGLRNMFVGFKASFKGAFDKDKEGPKP
jgi:hypothetical protein